MTKDEAVLVAEEVQRVKKRELWHRRWRNLAIVLMVVFIGQMFGGKGKKKPLDMAHIAMFNINEVITSESRFWEQFERLDDNNAKAALILMNSPGGTPGDSERLYNEISYVKSLMPVTILVENQATSGAYLASMASDRIYAYNSALIGSIGVVFSHMIMGKLFEKVGVEQEMFTVGAYKGYPNQFEKTPEIVAKNLQDALQSDQDWFLKLVVDSRGLDKSSVDKIKEAQIYGASDSLEIGLIDGIASRYDQIEMLRDEVGDLPIKDLDVDETESMLRHLLNPRRVLALLNYIGLRNIL